ncbi:hypothetical protein BKA64DRAFT_405326 [Cadophora sp. MPI-SDFR-AT-0126]|nr:hypothetical protein BKA64DRAFT_405326 [Leotiomycetes sp. MPI-SDFR-AT-0126]
MLYHGPSCLSTRQKHRVKANRGRRCLPSGLLFYAVLISNIQLHRISYCHFERFRYQSLRGLPSTFIQLTFLPRHSIYGTISVQRIDGAKRIFLAGNPGAPLSCIAFFSLSVGVEYHHLAVYSQVLVPVILIARPIFGTGSLFTDPVPDFGCSSAQAT